MAYQTYRYSTPRFMDDSVYRSGSSVLSTSSITRDPRQPRITFNESPRSEYRQIAVDEHGMAIDRRSQYEDSLYPPCGQMVRSYREDERRRTNPDYPSSSVSPHYRPIHPRLCRDGRFPPSFSRPLHVDDFWSMPDVDLQRILLAYELRQRSGDGLRRGAGDSQSRRAADVALLMQYLGQERFEDAIMMRRGR